MRFSSPALFGAGYIHSRPAVSMLRASRCRLWLTLSLSASVLLMQLPQKMVTGLSAPGVVTHPQWVTNIKKSSPAPVLCTVALNAYSIWEPAAALGSPLLFSGDPPPSFVVGSLTITITNSGSSDVAAPWQLELTSNHYEGVLEVSQNLSGLSWHDSPCGQTFGIALQVAPPIYVKQA